jgi:hypothetical protein
MLRFKVAYAHGPVNPKVAASQGGQDLYSRGHEIQDHITRHDYIWATHIDTVDEGIPDWIPYTFARVADEQGGTGGEVTRPAHGGEMSPIDTSRLGPGVFLMRHTTGGPASKIVVLN